MTQADIARVLELEHELKLHATAIAKMEQRDVGRPRAIRLSEAKAIADMFGLTIDEMSSPAEAEIEAVAREFAQLGAQADLLQAQTQAVMDRLRGLTAVMSIPEEQLTPPIRAARNKIIKSLSSLEGEHWHRVNAGHQFIRQLHDRKVRDQAGVEFKETEDLRALQGQAMIAVWMKLLHAVRPDASQVELSSQMKIDEGDSTFNIASLLRPPNDASPTWAMAASLAHILWGHGVPVELQQRLPNFMRAQSPSSIRAAKAAALAEMAREMQEEMEQRWPTVTGIYQEIEDRWGDFDALNAWVQDVRVSLQPKQDD
ncbi:hypothetical protein AMK32_36980 [Streptomyces sp. CB01883]|nr:hypothetical protein AMK32_36980 [Streptomyces sp. CB01883]